VAELKLHTVSTARGIDIEVRSGGSGPPLIWFHGLMGLAAEEPTLELLAESFTVHAPIWPGYGDIENEGAIEDMLDFALLGWDIVDALAAMTADRKPHLVGHSFGAMIAAEMAAVARHDPASLTLVAPFGLWLDEHPIPDPFAQLPYQLTELLLGDTSNAAKLLPPGLDMETDEGLAQFMVANARRLGTAGKVMFPIPNRRLSKRLYRVIAPTQVIMADGDQLITEPYGSAWVEAINGATLTAVADSGHLINIEQPERLAQAVAGSINS
jgi:pimeloyl-ACP methyl ester carboxylesterase